MHQLADRVFAAALIGVRAMRDVAVKILGDGNLRCQWAPGFGHRHILLLENSFPAIIGDFGGPILPFDLVEWGDVFSAENALELDPLLLGGGAAAGAGLTGLEAILANAWLKLDHESRAEYWLVKFWE